MASGAGGTGGGAGGGKIPTRRCHLRSFQPYQLGRQRHQVLDSDSLWCRGWGTRREGTGGEGPWLPTWMSRKMLTYFNKNLLQNFSVILRWGVSVSLNLVKKQKYSKRV